MIGGIMGLIIMIVKFFVYPYGRINFIIENSSVKEEINLIVMQSLCNDDCVKSIAEKYSNSLFKRDQYNSIRLGIYLNQFFPKWLTKCFVKYKLMSH
jgi:hypothetical protein